MKFISTLVLSFFMFFVNTMAQPTVFYTNLSNTTSPALTNSRLALTDLGSFRQTRFQMTAAQAPTQATYAFHSGTPAVPSYTTNWRPYTVGDATTRPFFLNTITVPADSANSARYNSASGGQDGNLSNLTNANYYTVNIQENAAANNLAAIWETSYNPTTFVSVSSTARAGYNYAGVPVTVTINTATSLGIGENVFVRYSTNGFTSSTIVQATFSATVGTATIPGQPNGNTVSYYVFSSTRTLAQLATAVANPGILEAAYDMATLNLINNGGANYNYTINIGYFFEGFESEFVPNTAAGPNVPSGWTQTRLGTLTSVPGTPGGSGQRDWARSVWSGTAWASNTAPNVNQIPYSTATNGPVGAAQGTGVLWFNDGWAAGSGTGGANIRRIETPSINLAASTNPILSFHHTQNTSTAALTVLGSTDGGTTWNTLAAFGAGTTWAWNLRNIFLPPIYKIATAKFALQISNTWGSNDVFIDNVVVQEATISNIVSTANGGLWSSPATWVGGFVPTNLDSVTIANNSVVTVDAAITVRNLQVGQGSSGVLQWNATSTNSLTVFNDITISSGARFLPYNTAGSGVTVNVGGNFTNNGYANFVNPSSLLNLNGSQQGSSMAQTLSGTGVFEGNASFGLFRSLFFQTTGTVTINTSQNLAAVNAFAHTAGSLVTNNKLTLDNSQKQFNRPTNNQVANVVVTNMGVGVANAPFVYGATATAWSGGGTATINTRYFSGNNVYVATVAGTFDAMAAPTHTTGVATNGSTSLLWIGTVGRLGTPFQATAVTVGTQYVYGNNLYTCTVAGIPDVNNPPIHVSGTAVSGAATFLYAGTAAQVTGNYDATTQTLRSLNLANAGSGYTSAPTVSINVIGGASVNPTASAVFIFGVSGQTSILSQSSGGGTVTGNININSTAGASAFSGVGSVGASTTSGVNYTIAPTVGFAGPTAINLVTNGGSGYAAAPTINVTGGTLISGTALTSSSFTITVANGQVVSVYLNASTTATYSVPPTLSFSSGTATLAFPAGCWPTATATIGSNGAIVDYTVTNAGFGYIAAPTVGIGTTSGTPEGGTFTTVASSPAARIANYTLTLGFFTPAPTNVVNTNSAFLPANGKLSSITMNSANGATFNSNIELFNSSPLTLTAGRLSVGTNTLNFSHPSYAGASGSATSSVVGRVVLNTPGGSVTRTFPYEAPVAVATGSGSLATGSNVLTLTSTITAKPTGSVTGGGTVLGTRGYRIQANAGSIFGTNPTITLNFNSLDTLITDNAGLLIGQGTATSGPWVVRSIGTGTGALSATGSRTTAIAGVGPIVPTGDDYFAWITTASVKSSAITGNWNNAATWSPSGVPSCTDVVFILNGHNVTANSAANVSASITINTGGTLTISGGDLTVGCTNKNSSLINNGSLAISNGVLNVNGNVLNTATSSYNQSGGTVNVDGNSGTLATSVPAGTNLFAFGTTSAQFTSTTGLSLTGGSLVIINPHASSTSAGGTSDGHAFMFWGSLAASNLYTGANFTLQFGDGTSTIAGGHTAGFQYNCWPGSGQFFPGKLVVNTGTGTNRHVTLVYRGGSLNDVDITSGEFRDNATTFYVGRNLNVAAGATYTATGTLYMGNFDNVGGAGVPTTNAQSINNLGTIRNLITTPTANLTSFTVNNTNTSGVTLNSPLQASGTATMVAGVVNTNNTNLLTVGISAASPGTFTYVGGRINGPYKKFVGASTGSQLLPLGTSTVNFPASVNFTTAPTTGGSITAQFIAGAPGNTGLPLNDAGTNIETVSNLGIWSITGSDGLTGGTFSLNLKATGITGVTNASQLRIIERNPMGSWMLDGTHAAGGTDTARRTGMTGFGEYAVAGERNINPLPVSLLNFSGNKVEKVNNLTWTTLTEQGNKGFELQRSIDGLNFGKIGFISSKGDAGNSSVALNYSFVDAKILETITYYYRLAQIDNNGTISFSKTVAIKGGKNSKMELEYVYPNPTTDRLNIVFADTKAQKVTLTVVDLTGKTVLSQNIQSKIGENNLVLNVNSLAKGTYTLTLSCANGCEISNKLFVKQ